VNSPMVQDGKGATTTKATLFTKYVSIGNDFVLIEGDVHEDHSEIAKRLCARNFGVGADGLLVVSMQDAGVELRMYNPDGTEDFCGNGLRCAALHARKTGWNGDSVPIHHMGRDVTVTFSMGGWIDVQIPAASFAPSDVPLADGIGEIFEKALDVGSEKVIATAVSTGSTHTILSCEGQPDDSVFQRVSPLLETHPFFPMRTSVIWAWFEKYNRIRIRIWERGVGETLGCGTGSAAVAAWLFRKNPNLVAAQVINPGGDCGVSLGPGGTLIVSAKAQAVYSGVA
jgi:diaminopimelate epimerase